jgi:hypothetical protein
MTTTPKFARGTVPPEYHAAYCKAVALGAEAKALFLDTLFEILNAEPCAEPISAKADMEDGTLIIHAGGQILSADGEPWGVCESCFDLPIVCR